MGTGNELDGRRSVRERSSGICEICGAARATEVHHRKNRSQGGTWRPANLLHVCRVCHQWVTEHPTAAVAAGFSVRAADDPTDAEIHYRGQGWVRFNDDDTLTLL